MRDLYIGLISGTSLDGVDAVLVEFHDEQPPLVLAHGNTPYPAKLLKPLQDICREPAVEMELLGQLDRELGDLFGLTAQNVLHQTALYPQDIRAIGTHGQTVRHQPTGHAPFTLQIGDANRIAEQTGITTVADFRRRDMAAGGEGAPLVPAFHRAVFQRANENRIVLNIGGIANITCLPKDTTQTVTGFDCGPGNTLLDNIYKEYFDGMYDDRGVTAASGQIDQAMLGQMLNDPYFKQTPPKSTGPEYFSIPWLQQLLDTALAPQDLLATLCELTAVSISESIRQFAVPPDRLLVCGGGAHNDFLIQRMAEHIHCPIETTETYGIGPDWVEAAAFAWLARQTMNGHPGNIPEVTGASRAVVLGAIYPA